ncbi:MAG: hypothetical protein Unbinned706contig1000_53 [Prokaryotic dsDNA virus sp.]|nr:MAG: hypothetical protein Unbinned706contig1000_53 [Prokaryotic dsDNA virus sp.]|tara:strand:- start:1044 stop:1232 length:189 start_codon:yes stop_codon:yes gene_type:complete
MDLPSNHFYFKYPIAWDSNLLLSIQKALDIEGYFVELHDIEPKCNEAGDCYLAIIDYYVKLQ